MYVRLHRDELTKILTAIEGTSACEYVEAIAHREIAWLSHYAESLPPSMENWSASKGQSDRQAHIDLLGKYLSVVAQLLPKEPELLAPFLWHRDIHPGNLFVHDGKISSVIDWQSCWVGPLILRARAPRLLDYNGEIVLKLPPEYGEMPEDERRLVEYKVQQSLQVYSYEHKTAGRNPLLNQVLRYPHGKMLSNVVEFASASWDRDILPLRDCLIRIERYEALFTLLIVMWELMTALGTGKNMLAPQPLAHTISPLKKFRKATKTRLAITICGIFGMT